MIQHQLYLYAHLQEEMHSPSSSLAGHHVQGHQRSLMLLIKEPVCSFLTNDLPFMTQLSLTLTPSQFVI